MKPKVPIAFNYTTGDKIPYQRWRKGDRPKVEEYKKRHDKIWPELRHLLKEAGIGKYLIFHDPETDCLFAYQENEGKDSQSMGENPIVQKWWEYMSDLMETHPDLSPKQLNLNQVFSL